MNVHCYSLLLSHYFIHGGFFDEDDFILKNVHKLADIPCTILQGRYDVVCPMRTAWELHQVRVYNCTISQLAFCIEF